MRKPFNFFGLLASAILVFSACNAPVEKEVLDLDQIKVEIQAMEDAFAAGEKARDADAVVAYYSEDAVSHTRNKEPLRGKAAIRENVANDIAADTTGSYNVYKVVDLYAEGNMAVEIGSWTKYDAAGTEMDHGNYMSYFEKRDGKYVCVRDMSTTSTPVPAPAPAPVAADTDM
jgi:ketosteroid isomerase-like protein